MSVARRTGPGRLRFVARVALLGGLVWSAPVAPVTGHVADAPLGFGEVLTEAPLVVRGRVTGLRPVRQPDRELSTAATVAVEVVLKGEPVTFVSVVLPGGRQGRVRTVMIGAPELEVGDRAVLFLRRGPDGLWRPVGLSAGVYRIRISTTGLATVRAPVALGATTSAGAVRRGESTRAPMALTEFESLVRVVGRGVVRRIAPIRRTR